MTIPSPEDREVVRGALLDYLAEYGFTRSSRCAEPDCPEPSVGGGLLLTTPERPGAEARLVAYVLCEDHYRTGAGQFARFVRWDAPSGP